MLTRFIRVRTQIEGLHHWPAAAPPDGYLAHPHRHLFVAELDITVDHDDRELEINAVTRWVTEQMASFAAGPPRPAEPLDFGRQSCEHLATRLVNAVTRRYGRHRTVRCAVVEDGLLGGGVTWHPEPAATDAPLS